MASRRSHAPTDFFRQEDNLFRHEDKKTGFLLMAYKRMCNNILAARASKQHGSAKRDLPSETHCKLRSSAAVGTDNHPTTTVPRSGTDISTMILRTVHRSRFAEPRESVSVFAYPQRRSFGACCGFLIDTCPIGTRRSSYCLTVTEVAKLRSTAQQRNHKQQNKLRRLWRLAVATHPRTVKH